jgi:hypothetical protein
VAAAVALERMNLNTLKTPLTMILHEHALFVHFFWTKQPQVLLALGRQPRHALFALLRQHSRSSAVSTCMCTWHEAACMDGTPMHIRGLAATLHQQASTHDTQGKQRAHEVDWLPSAP